MKCEYCDNEVPYGVTRCPSCGAVVKAEPPPPPPQPAQPVQPTIVAGVSPVGVVMPGAVVVHPSKSKTVYVILAILIGGLGIHNFYAGYILRGLVQLLLSTLSCGWLGLPVWIWAILEAIFTSRDANGVPFS